MPRATGETQLKNTTLEVLLLPRGSRSVTEIVITNTQAIQSGDVEENGEALMRLSASASANVRAGTSLSFIPTNGTNTRRKQALILYDTTIGTTATDVRTAATIDDIPANHRAIFIPGLKPVFGVQEFSFQSQDQTVDTTDTQSGAGTESAIVRSGLDFTINCIERIGDRGLTLIKDIGLNFGLKGREVYARLTYPDGEVHQGAAKIMNYSQPGNQNEVKRANFTLQFQGESYRYIKAYNFDDTFTADPLPGSGGGGGVTPPTYDTTLTVTATGTPVDGATVSFNATTGDVFRFNAKSGGSGLPATMLLFVGSSQVAQVDFTQQYVGDPFSTTIGGTTYTGTFANSNNVVLS